MIDQELVNRDHKDQMDQELGNRDHKDQYFMNPVKEAVIQHESIEEIESGTKTAFGKFLWRSIGSATNI